MCSTQILKIFFLFKHLYTSCGVVECKPLLATFVQWTPQQPARFFGILSIFFIIHPSDAVFFVTRNIIPGDLNIQSYRKLCCGTTQYTHTPTYAVSVRGGFCVWKEKMPVKWESMCRHREIQLHEYVQRAPKPEVTFNINSEKKHYEIERKCECDVVTFVWHSKSSRMVENEKASNLNISSVIEQLPENWKCFLNIKHLWILNSREKMLPSG